MAQAENKDLPNEENSSSDETLLINKKVGFGHNSSRECAEDEGVSARQSRGLKRWFISKSDDPKNSVAADKHCRDIR